MPLYSDSNYYYSGGSSQLYSPYYPGSASATPSYNPYSSTYNRAITGSYVVPISTPRTSGYTSSHGLSTSRYQPKLSTITETSPLISAARHTTLMPLTRIQSPKYTSYTTPSTVHTPKYTPPRPILINTADIDVSANRYRKRKEEILGQAQREIEYNSPSSSIKRRNSSERKSKDQQEEEERKRKEQLALSQQMPEPSKAPSPEKHVNRSTIKRNRAVVRLSTIRSRSKDRNRNKKEDSSSPEPEKKFKDLPIYQPPEETNLKWRQKLADDLAAIPTYPNKKSPGDVLREKYLIQDNKSDEDYAAQCRAQRMATGLPKETIEQVIVELDPLHHTVRRLSIPQCPTFHDICKDISSDKIDDDLNAGELRRRASIIHGQEQELLNELQKSGSGTFQMITMERRGSHDSTDEVPHKRHSKRASKKGKKIRTKITAIVEVENAPPLGAIMQEKDEGFDSSKSLKPKFTVNVESVEEHHEIHKVIKLPKRKSVKRSAAKIKEQELPEGFMTPLPKPQSSPKKKIVKPEVFTFDEKSVEQAKQEELDGKAANKSLTSSVSLDIAEKPKLAKTLEKSNSINIELKTPLSPKALVKEDTPPLTPKNKTDSPKPLDKSSSINFELKTPTTPKTPLAKEPETPKTLKPVDPKPLLAKEPETPKALRDLPIPDESKSLLFKDSPKTKTSKELSKTEENKPSFKTLKTSISVDSAPKPHIQDKGVEKSSSLIIDLNKKEEKKEPITPKASKDLSKTEDSKSSPKTPKTFASVESKKEEDKKTLKTSMSMETETKPKLSKTLEKSNSVNIELKSPSTPKTPISETIKEETWEDSKDIKKNIRKSESGEDFWSQIGTPESPISPKAPKVFSKPEEAKASPKPPKALTSVDSKKVEEKKTLKSSISLEAETKPKLAKTLEKSNSVNIELKSPSTPKTPITETIREEPLEVKTAIPKDLKNNIRKSESGEDFWAQIGTPASPITPKTPKEFPKPEEPKASKLSTPVEPKKVEEKKILKSSISVEAESKPKLAKTLEKSNSINVELKSPTTPKTPIKETIKEEPLEIKTAIPKDLKKNIMKSDSGEDFWAQIGSRESLYMNKRKKDLVETQWEKRQELLETTKKEDVKNIEEIKSVVTSQKIEALKKADREEKESKGVVGRSSSTETAFKKKSPEKDKKRDTDLKTNDKLEGAKTPLVTKLSKEATTSSSSLSASSPLSSPITKTAVETTTVTKTSTPKISGQTAKSPEHQEPGEQNKFFPTTTATATKIEANKNDNNKNEIAINKTNEKQQLAKTLTLPTENTKITTTTSANSSVAAEATATTKQPETKQINKPSTAATDKTKAVTKTKSQDLDSKITAAKKSTAAPAVSDKKSPSKSKAKTSPNAINADQFIAKAPAKTNGSPVKTPTTSSKNAPTKKTPDQKKTTLTTSTNEQTKTAAAAGNAASKLTSAAATTTSQKTGAATITTNTKSDDNNQQICNKSHTEINANNKSNTEEEKKNEDSGTSNSNTCGSNLSKFATVSNLAQCLHDVDADLADYLPSSADISENEEDFNTDDSDFDYSSIDGWENLTPSMKKKVKQRRRKEKQAEQARFDPQKKVKIDTTRKLYVKEEAPRYPLVATPRPLWKREKIVYPDEDSDDESDSEESGSTEETEDSDECTTSEEYEDELSPMTSAVGGVKSGSGGVGDAGVVSGSPDPNKENSAIIRMSTCSNDSGFEGGTAPSSPKKMLECDVNCHKKCERLTANLCGVNQKLIVEALANVKRGARETRDSPSTPPSSNPAYKIEATEEQDETSYTYSQFQKSGRFTPPATIIPRFKNYTVDDFHFLAVLGKGSFGKVLLAELRDTTYYYAVKCLKKDVVLEDDDVDSTLIERKVLALGTKHPYLCHLFCTFQTESHLFFVMEYLNGGDLMFHIQESGRFTEERARFYGAEIVSGLKFLHKKGIIYRDLKLDNVLLDYEGHVRIADFGMCKLQIYLDKTADSFCGTPDYMAPEIIKGDKYNQNVDWWSFGVLLYEMLIGQSPFSGCDEDELFWSICNELPWFPVYISAEATHILKGLLEKDYTKRIGSQYSPAGDIVENIFFRPIDWNLLEKRQIEPPFRPQVKHPLDTQYFDRVFTRERVRLTPIDKDILQSMDQKQFLGFTYTNPHITLD